MTAAITYGTGQGWFKSMSRLVTLSDFGAHELGYLKKIPRT